METLACVDAVDDSCCAEFPDSSSDCCEVCCCVEVSAVAFADEGWLFDAFVSDDECAAGGFGDAALLEVFGELFEFFGVGGLSGGVFLCDVGVESFADRQAVLHGDIDESLPDRECVRVVALEVDECSFGSGEVFFGFGVLCFEFCDRLWV